MWGSHVTRKQLRNTVNGMHGIPGPPEERRLRAAADPMHQLPIDRESEIASNLAFLSATSDDNTQIMTVCLEEHTSRIGMTIRLAANTAVLEEVVDGFKSLTRILEGAAQRGRLGFLFPCSAQLISRSQCQS